MKLTGDLITSAIRAANDIFSQQTVDDLAIIKQHCGAAYNEAAIVAEIAVKLVLRVAGLKVSQDARAVSPIDALVYDALERYEARYRD